MIILRGFFVNSPRAYGYITIQIRIVTVTLNCNFSIHNCYKGGQ